MANSNLLIIAVLLSVALDLQIYFYNCYLEIPILYISIFAEFIFFSKLLYHFIRRNK